VGDREFIWMGNSDKTVLPTVAGKVTKWNFIVRLSFREKGSWFLLHNNVPAVSALIIKRFLANCWAVVITSPKNCPDSTLTDFFYIH